MHAGMPALPPIAVAMVGLDPAQAGVGGAAPSGERVRAVLAWLSKSGARGVRLDATAAGIRPRELDRSGRRDLGALLRRTELTFAGVDLFIPPEHFGKPDAADRAVSAVLGAIDLAADLSQLAIGAIVTRLISSSPSSVSVVFPPTLAPDMLSAITDHAISRGVLLANHAWPIQDASPGSDQPVGIGLDPVTAFASGADPVSIVANLGKRLICARLNDLAGAGTIGASRVVPGTGRLDLNAYLITLSTIGYNAHVALDLTGLRDPAQAIAQTSAL